MTDDLGAAPEEPATRVTPRERVAAYVRSSWPWLLLVVAIIAVAAFVRFWDLGRQSMWLDELYTFNTTAYGPVNAVRSTARDTNPPLFYILQSFSLMVLPRSEWGMRALSAAIGVLATGAMYLAGSMLFDRKTGAWAAMMFAVSLIAVRYSQEARMYSLLMLLAAVELWLFALLLRRPTVTRAALLGVAIVCLAYTHVYGYVAAPMLLVPVLLLPRVRQRVGSYMAVTYAVAGLLFLRWAFVIPAQIHLVRAQAGAGTWWMKPPDDLVASLVSHYAEFAPSPDPVVGFVFVALMFVGFAVRPTPAELPAAGSLDTEGVHESDIRWLLLALATLPILFGLAVSFYVTPISTIRNTLVSLPAAYILAVHGGLKLRKPIGVIALSGLLVTALLGLPDLYRSTQKGEWRQVTQMVTSNPKAGVVAQDWVSASNIDSYATILGQRDSLNLIWADKMDAKPAPSGRYLGDGEEFTLPGWIWRWDRVYAVAQDKDSAVFRFMDQLDGWRLAQTQDAGTPIVREYEKIEALTPTSTPGP